MVRALSSEHVHGSRRVASFWLLSLAIGIYFDLTQTITTVFTLNDALISLSSRPIYQQCHVTLEAWLAAHKSTQVSTPPPLCFIRLIRDLQVLKQLRVQHNQSSAYHAQSQGALEHLHQTLKFILRTYCTESGNVFVVSLAFADLVVAFYPYPMVLYAIFHDGWSLGETQCKVSGFLMGLSVIGSIFNITGIAINRYCYICHSFSYDKLYSYRNTLLLVALIWLLTIVAIVPNFFVGSLQYDARIYSCTFAQTVSTSYTITVVVIHFFVPIAVVTFCYLRIWILVIQVRRKVKSEVRPRIKPSDLRNFITMFVVFVLFAICWAPLNFIGLAVAVNPEAVAPHIPEWLFVVSYFMAYFNSCLNAIIYGLLNQNFRREYKRIIMSVWMPHLFFQETSRGGTEGMKSKPSPGLNNNEQVKGETL